MTVDYASFTVNQDTLLRKTETIAITLSFSWSKLQTRRAFVMNDRFFRLSGRNDSVGGQLFELIGRFENFGRSFV